VSALVGRVRALLAAPRRVAELEALVDRLVIDALDSPDPVVDALVVDNLTRY